MDLILLALAIVYFFNRSTLTGLNSADYPNVPEADFEKWKTNEIDSRDIIIGIGLVWFGLEIAWVVLSQGRINILLVSGIGAVVMLGAMILSAIPGGRASKIKKQYGIRWPPRTNQSWIGFCTLCGSEC